MDELERLRKTVNKVRQAAKEAQTWHTVLDPLEILDIVGRDELKVTIDPPKLVPMKSQSQLPYYGSGLY